MKIIYGLMIIGFCASLQGMDTDTRSIDKGLGASEIIAAAYQGDSVDMSKLSRAIESVSYWTGRDIPAPLYDISFITRLQQNPALSAEAKAFIKHLKLGFAGKTSTWKPGRSW